LQRSNLTDFNPRDLASVPNDLSKLSLTSGGAVTILDFPFDGNGAELGFFFLLSLICVFLLMDQLRGRILRMKIYIMNRDF
jgi:hypothetical protein